MSHAQGQGIRVYANAENSRESVSCSRALSALCTERSIRCRICHLDYRTFNSAGKH